MTQETSQNPPRTMSVRTRYSESVHDRTQAVFLYSIVYNTTFELFLRKIGRNTKEGRSIRDQHQSRTFQPVCSIRVRLYLVRSILCRLLAKTIVYTSSCSLYKPTTDPVPLTYRLGKETVDLESGNRICEAV